LEPTSRLASKDGKTLDFVETAAHRLCSNPLIPLGDLNVDLLNEGERKRNNQRQEVTANVIELLGPKTVNHRFLWKRKRGVRTWWQRQLGGTRTATADHTLFQNEDDATSYKLKSPHFDRGLVRTELVTRSAKERQEHVKKRTSFPIPICPKCGAGIGDKTLETLC
jgi:hypothetical protein